MNRSSQALLLSSTLVLLGGCGGGGSTPPPPPPPPPLAATQFSIRGPTNTGAGFAFPFSVTARDAANQLVASYSGKVHFTSSDAAALLPPDSTLVNGAQTFNATLTNAGFQTITGTDTASGSLRGALSVTIVAAEFPVTSFGAKGDGQTDDTAAIQAAINAASAAGGGSVVLGMARYYTSGTLVLPQGVVLSGVTEGPFDANGLSQMGLPSAPTLLVTNTNSQFLTLQGIGAGVTDILFHYPKQVTSSASVPNVYPYTILVTAPGTKVARCTVTNAYNFLDIEVGRVLAEDLFIGAFHNDINVDHATDHLTLRRLVHTVFWDVVENQQYPQPIDTWVLNNGTALVVARADSLEISDFFVFSRFVGILLTDSSDTSQSPTCGYGTGSDIDVEDVQYGIVVTASNRPGYKFASLYLESHGNIGQAAVQVRGGGSLPPKILINGVSEGGPVPWALGAFPPAPVGNMIVVNLLP